MARFITRIQLYSASQNDYSTLHSEMKKESFILIREFTHEFQTATSPTEEYVRKSSTLVEVNAAVLRAARKTGREYKFTVMKETFLKFEVRAAKFEVSKHIER